MRGQRKSPTSMMYSGNGTPNWPKPARRELDLTVESRVQAGLTAVRDKAKQETEAALSLRVREKEEQIASMQRQIEDLKRKAEQGSQQLQGEVQELALEALLRQRFTRDLIEPIPKGEFAAISFNGWSARPVRSLGRFYG